MPHTVSVTLSDREHDALDWIRTSLRLRNDEAAMLAGLYKLAAWLEPNVDPKLFRLDRDPPPKPRKKGA